MNSITRSLFVFCVLLNFISLALSSGEILNIDKENINPYEQTNLKVRDTLNQTDMEITQMGDRAESLRERSIRTKPLKSIVMGIYKNYKSTYLGNKTLTEYKQTLRESMKNKLELKQKNGLSESTSSEDGNAPPETKEEKDVQIEAHNENDVVLPSKDRNEEFEQQEEQYHLGPTLNMSLDLKKSIITVNLDGESIKELITSRWLNDNSDEGRGKKYEMVTRILPLFILPFLIQSAIVPFLVTKLKLLLMKSMLVGKLAIFLLIISAFRNGNKMMQTYEVAPSYWASEPSRRSEIAAAASNMAYNGYRVEGKPAAWVN